VQGTPLALPCSTRLMRNSVKVQETLATQKAETGGGNRGKNGRRSKQSDKVIRLRAIRLLVPGCGSHADRCFKE
jgi:hypothetical protein